jgi:hypothetical protein
MPGGQRGDLAILPWISDDAGVGRGGQQNEASPPKHWAGREEEQERAREPRRNNHTRAVCPFPPRSFCGTCRRGRRVAVVRDLLDVPFPAESRENRRGTTGHLSTADDTGATTHGQMIVRFPAPCNTKENKPQQNSACPLACPGVATERQDKTPRLLPQQASSQRPTHPAPPALASPVRPVASSACGDTHPG